jgi:hypothetical protein
MSRACGGSSEYGALWCASLSHVAWANRQAGCCGGLCIVVMTVCEHAMTTVCNTKELANAKAYVVLACTVSLGAWDRAFMIPYNSMRQRLKRMLALLTCTLIRTSRISHSNVCRYTRSKQYQ